jgi:signal peptide peptidase SppA
MPGIGSHLINRLNDTSWYLRPQVLQTFESVLNSKLIDNLNKMEFPNEEESDETNPLNRQIINDKIIINIEGTLMRKAGYLDAMCGFIGMNILEGEIVSALNNPQINHIIFNWDCPGGSTAGTPQLANLIFEARQQKRITSCVSGCCCSAAYFIGSAADDLYATSEIDDIGSIGVVAMHVDRSEQDKMNGLKYTYIYAGEHKIDGNPHEPLNNKSFESINRTVQYDYEVFLKAVEKNRSIDREYLMKYAEGQVFKAGELVNTKMIDGIISLDKLLRS